jgi:hypothetical protein
MDTDGSQFGVGLASPLHAQIGDGVDSAAVTAASRLQTEATQSGTWNVGTVTTVTTITNPVTAAQGASGAEAWGVRVMDSAGSQYGYGAASPFFVSACVTNRAGSAAGSPLFSSITNLAGSAAGSPLFVSACITNLAGSAAGSPTFVSLTNLAGSAAGSPLFVSQNNMTGSAAGSPTFVSITNLAGSAAGSPLFTRVGDGTDTAFVDSASRLGIAITDGTNAFGLAGSPLPIVPVLNQVYYSGSLLSVNLADVSASAAGCTVIVASSNGFATVVIGATFTTSSCQFIGWIASNTGAGSAAVQTRMPFGTNGGMTEADLLWQFPSGSTAVMTTTSACVVAGRLKYIRVAS